MTLVTEAPTVAEDTGIQSYLVTFIIRRFDPETDAEPRWVDYDVELYATDRVLDALQTDELCPCNWSQGEEVLRPAA